MANPKYGTFNSENVVDISTRRKSGGEPPAGDENMEARVTRLEGQFEKLNDKVDGLRIDVAVLKEKVSNLPSKGFIVSATISALAIFSAVIIFKEHIAGLIAG